MFQIAADVKTYTLAGNATITLSSLRTGARYTFKIGRAEDDAGNPKDVWFVGLLTGPDNYADYQYMGVVSNGTFKLTAKSKYGADSVPVRAFQFFWKHIAQDRMPPEMEIRHEGACGRCGRKLTVPASIDRGIGPECWGKMGG
jgi:hypothetical protein